MTDHKQPTVLCKISDLIPNSGICAKAQGTQIALFYLPEETPQVYAIGNWDPIGKANVLSRGIVGDINQRVVVASPLYKQHFDLVTGECIEDSEVTLPVFAVEINEDSVVITD